MLEKWAHQRGDQIALTYLDYRRNSEGTASSLTWNELATRVRVVSSWLRRSTRPGERAAILVDQGPEYLVAFLAAQRAGLVAVPLHAPADPGGLDRLGEIVTDAMPHIALTTRDRIARVGKFLDTLEPPVRQIMAVDTLDEEFPGMLPAEVGLDDPAYLQYTAGSVGDPAGVLVTHGNAVAGAWQAVIASDAAPGRSVAVNWLPLWQDMGMVLTVFAPLLLGARTVFMEPGAFLDRPVRWLRALSGVPGAISAAPNSAFAYCAAKIPEREKASLRLDQIGALLDAGEPVRPDVLDEFASAFAQCGFKPQAHRVCYGLSEATLLVSASPAGKTPKRTVFDRRQLAMGRAVPALSGESRTTTLVSTGQPIGQLAKVVDPETRRERPEGRVGEIWVSGPNVARGYWQRFEDSAQTFCALLHDHAEAAEPRWWLRTGDLGVLVGGELYVTGRVEELITAYGRDHYPQDVEATVAAAHPVLRTHGAAAFAGPEADGAVVLVEIGGPKGDHGWVADTVRRAVEREHGLPLHEVIVLPAGGLPRTASGKIARAACRQQYADGVFTPAAALA